MKWHLPILHGILNLKQNFILGPSENIMAEAKDFLIACGPLIDITPDNTLLKNHNILDTELHDAVRQCLILDAVLAPLNME